MVALGPGRVRQVRVAAVPAREGVGAEPEERDVVRGGEVEGVVAGDGGREVAAVHGDDVGGVRVGEVVDGGEGGGGEGEAGVADGGVVDGGGVFVEGGVELAVGPVGGGALGVVEEGVLEAVVGDALRVEADRGRGTGDGEGGGRDEPDGV